VHVSTTNRPTGLRHLRVEDLLLFAWLVVSPVVLPRTHSTGFASGSDPIGGLLDLAALCGAAACLTARRADASHTGLVGDRGFAYAIGPIFGAVAFAIDDSAARLGLAGSATLIPLALPVVAAIAARLYLPPTTAAVRRALVTPFILAASGFFSGFLSGLTDLFDLGALGAAVSGGRAGEALAVLGLGLLGVLVFYVMLIYAPRQVADREGTPLGWALRFALFAVGLSRGATLAAGPGG
jgi:hypothetical protein